MFKINKEDRNAAEANRFSFLADLNALNAAPITVWTSKAFYALDEAVRHFHIKKGMNENLYRVGWKELVYCYHAGQEVASLERKYIAPVRLRGRNDAMTWIMNNPKPEGENKKVLFLKHGEKSTRFEVVLSPFAIKTIEKNIKKLSWASLL